MTGVSYVEISTFSTTDPSAAPTAYTAGNTPITVRQKALVEEKRIEVTVSYV